MPDITRYSVETSRDEMRRERRVRTIEWAALAAACVVIVVMVALLVSGSFA
jgi:hypothetical protein